MGVLCRQNRERGYVGGEKKRRSPAWSEEGGQEGQFWAKSRYIFRGGVCNTFAPRLEYLYHTQGKGGRGGGPGGNKSRFVSPSN